MKIFLIFICLNLVLLIYVTSIRLKMSNLSLKETKKLNSEIFELKLKFWMYFILTFLTGSVLVVFNLESYLLSLIFIMFCLNFLYGVKLVVLVYYCNKRFEENLKIESAQEQKRNKLLNKLNNNPFKIENNTPIIDTSINLKKLIKIKKGIKK